jgi:hypothetical protein
MKVKILIFLLFVCSSHVLVFSQNKIDTTAYYMQFENRDYIQALEFCISDLKKWNQVNYPQGGIILVKINPSDVDNFCLNVTQIFTMSDVLQVLPDHYSYLSGEPILWVTGKMYLEKNDSTFRELIFHKFDRYLFDDLRYDNIIDPKNPDNVNYRITSRYSKRTSKREISGDNSRNLIISEKAAKKFKSTNIDIPKGIDNYHLTFFIKKKNNEITIDKSENVYQKIIISKN